MSDELTRFMQEATDEFRLSQARTERQAERWHDQLAAETMTLSGLLVDLHERGTSIHLDTKRGRRRRGIVSAVGSDCIALRSDDKPTMLIRTREIAVIKLDLPNSSLKSVSDRAVKSGQTFAGVLNELCESQALVRLIIGDTDEARSGEIVAVGADLVAMKSNGEIAYLSMEQISELAVLSGLR